MGPVTGSKIRVTEKLSPPRVLSPWSDDCQPAVNRGSTGTSPVAAVLMFAFVSGHQSFIHRDKPNGTNLVSLLSWVAAAWTKRNHMRGNAFEQPW